MKCISDSYKQKGINGMFVGTALLGRDKSIIIISRTSLDLPKVCTNSREVLSVGEPKPRGHIQQDLFFL